MAVFGTSNASVMMPKNIAAGMVTKTQSTSTVARLSNQEPMRFGEVDIITFNDFPRMEYVAEGADKGSTSVGFGAVTAKPYKGHVTLRFNEEVQWADEDYQLGIIREVGNAGAIALSRGLDLGVLHRINPINGSTASIIDTWVDATQLRAQLGAKDADAAIREAVGLLVDRSVPATGLAIDPKLSWALSGLQTKSGGSDSGVPRYPSLGFGANITDFGGLPAAQSDTVSGTPEAADTGVRAIVGDFTNGIRWGVQRQLPIEIIRWGDPDGQGDLKRKNQIALRLEIVYGWYADASRFAVLESKVVSSVTFTPTAAVVGTPVQLKNVATYDDASTADVTAATTWTVDNAAKGTVSSTGLFTPLDASATAPKVTATYGGKTKQSTITITA